MKTNIKEVNEHINKLNNEVARLRELLAMTLRWIPVFTSQQKEQEAIREELARLAPAPEEPVDDWRCPHCGSTTGTWFSRVEPMGDICDDCGKAVDDEPVIKESLTTEPASTPTDLNQPNKENTASLNDWRELGADEVIQEGDECRWVRESQFNHVMDSMLGGEPRRFMYYRFRTRRPLPKAQEKMPLEKELDYLTKEASRAADIHNHVLIVDCLRYLRDEIHNLKDQPHFHHQSYCRKCKEAL